VKTRITPVGTEVKNTEKVKQIDFKGIRIKHELTRLQVHW
jgi:hypothetical protein